ncbi:MAG TPA: tetratricopeptide repeat protein [Rhizomicrobium sp.]|nr:tetratricopeptide repeat protein [Rhizomicrobium sp.]
MSIVQHSRGSSQDVLKRVTAALHDKDVSLATRLASQAIDDGLEHPLFLNLRAFRLENEGCDTEALSDLRRAARLAPHDPIILNALGLAYARCGYHDEAVEAFEAAVTEQPDFSQAHFNNGWSLEEIGDLAGAKECYLRAHRNQPNAAEPLGRLAGLAARRGAWAEVFSYAELALARDPHNASAVMALGQLEIENGAFGKAEKRLRTFLGRPT